MVCYFSDVTAGQTVNRREARQIVCCLRRLQRELVILLHIAIVQELCESRGGRPGLSVLTSLLVSVDVKLY